METNIKKTMIGSIEIILLEDFLTLIPTDYSVDGIISLEDIEYTTKSKSIEPRFNMGQDSVIIDKALARAIPGDFLTVIRASLYLQARYSEVKGSYEEMIDKMVKKHIIEFGTPTHVIDLGGEMFMPANPNDFRIYTTGVEHALCMLDMRRTIIYK